MKTVDRVHPSVENTIGYKQNQEIRSGTQISEWNKNKGELEFLGKNRKQKRISGDWNTCLVGLVFPHLTIAQRLTWDCQGHFTSPGSETLSHSHPGWYHLSSRSSPLQPHYDLCTAHLGLCLSPLIWVLPLLLFNLLSLLQGSLFSFCKFTTGFNQHVLYRFLKDGSCTLLIHKCECAFNIIISRSLHLAYLT